MKIKNILLSLTLLFMSSVLLSGCGTKKSSNVIPTPTPRLIELKANERPYIKLVPSVDGHRLTMSITRIPSTISNIEYELIYTASDQGNEIEKGLGDTIELNSNSIERTLLLGTESCTNGCKYKYDEGITGGTLSLTLITKEDQVITYQSQFSLKSASDLKKDGKIELSTENFTVSATPATKSEFFVLLKNFGLPATSTDASTAYSIFSSGDGNGKITKIEPTSATKDNSTKISGDYLIK